MLADLERKLGAILSSGLATRTHLDLASGAAATPAAGRGTIGIAIGEIAPQPGFTPHDMMLTGLPDSPRSRRVLPIGFVARLSFRMRPAADTVVALSDARALMLEDVSTAAHLLGDPAIGDGSAFAVAAPDPGFDVRTMALDGGEVVPGLNDGLLSASLAYRGEARVWPVGVTQPEGVIDAVDPIIVPLPLLLAVADGTVRPGAETRVRGSLGQIRRVAGDGTSAPSDIAVAIMADVPIAERGTIPGGVAGTETGVTVLPLGADGALDIRYAAPAGNPGPNGRTEYVAVHLATPDRQRGIFLGSAAIRLVPAP